MRLPAAAALCLYAFASFAGEQLSDADRLTAAASVKMTGAVCGYLLPEEENDALEAAVATLAGRVGHDDDSLKAMLDGLASTMKPYRDTICTKEAEAAFPATARRAAALAKQADALPPGTERLQALYFYEIAAQACEFPVDPDDAKALALAQDKARADLGMSQAKADEMYASVTALVGRVADNLCAPEGAFVKGYRDQLRALLEGRDP